MLPQYHAQTNESGVRACVWIDNWLGLEVMDFELDAHVFRPHTHDTLMLGLIVRGCKSFERERKAYLASSGMISLVNPGELHSGRRASEALLRYFALYVPAKLLCESVFGTIDHAIPEFRAGVIVDHDLYQSLGSVFRAISSDTSRLERETMLSHAMCMLTERYYDPRTQPAKVATESQAIRRAKDMVDAKYAEDLSIGEIAVAARLSRFHLMHAFRASVGVPLHAYQLQVRVDRAKSKLAAGLAAAQVAVEVGFADQSHFTKRFKGIVGVTPAQYQRSLVNRRRAPINGAPGRMESYLQT